MGRRRNGLGEGCPRQAEGPFERPIGILTRKQAEPSLPAREFVDLLVAPLKARTRHA